jgi:EmrB/QacA subfamily drug resistance transporter
VLAVILAAQMMVTLDITIVLVALPHIQRTFGFSSSSLSWVLNAYVLTFGGLLMLGARSGDLLGRRRTFLAGIALFSASSFTGGIATTGWMLLAARAFQGIGGALAAPTALALLTVIFPEGQRRVRAIGLFTAVSAAGAAMGLVVGGLLTQWASWRWVMFVNVPIGLSVIVVGSIVLTETQRRHGRFDFLGAVTSTAGMGGIVFGLVEAGTSGWGSVTTMASLLGGAALIGAFIKIEASAAEPILPLRVLTNPTAAAANTSRVLAYGGTYGSVFFLTQFLQDVQHRSALVTGLGWLPSQVSVVLASQLAGSKILVKHVHPKALMLLGTAVSAGGLLLLTQLRANTSYGQVAVSLILIGTGMGLSFVPLTTAAFQGVDPADAGAASGVVNVTQQVGAALGLAVLVSVYDSANTNKGFSIHPLGVTFAVATAFALAALAIIALALHAPVPELEPTPLDAELDLEGTG